VAANVLLPGTPASARDTSWTERHWWMILFVALGAVLVVLVGLPVVGLVAGSVSVTGLPGDWTFTLAHYWSVLGDARTYTLLLTSLAFALGSVVIGLGIGAPLAWFVERTSIGPKPLIRAVILAQVAIPSVVTAMSWVLLASPRIGMLNTLLRSAFGPGITLNVYSLPGMIVVQGMTLVPLVFVMLSPALRNLDTNLEEAALAAGSSVAGMMWRVTFPVIRPAVLAVSLYAFVLGLLGFDIPAVLGIPGRVFVFSSEIYFAIRRYATPLYGQAAALSVVTLALVVAVGAWYLRASRGVLQFATMTGKVRTTHVPIRRLALAVGYAWVLGYLLVGLVLPLVVVGWTSLLPFFAAIARDKLSLLSLANYKEILATPNVARALRNTLVNSTIAATVGTALAALIAWVVQRSPLRGRRWLDLLALVPVVIPGVILGLSLQYVYLTLAFLPVYGTLWILTISHVTLSLPFGTRSTSGAIAQIHPELEEAALASGRSWTATFGTITLPLIKPTLLFVWLWTFVHSVRDLSTSVMLYAPQNPVLANLLWQLWDYGNLTTGAAVGTLLLFGLFVIALVAQRLLDRARATSGLL
jgi:iron(III) transport system permease protein